MVWPSSLVQEFFAICFECYARWCGVVEKRPESEPNQLQIVGKPMPPGKAKAVLSEIGSNFAYGSDVSYRETATTAPRLWASGECRMQPELFRPRQVSEFILPRYLNR